MDDELTWKDRQLEYQHFPVDGRSAGARRRFGGVPTSTLLSLRFAPAALTIADDMSKLSVAALGWLLRSNGGEEMTNEGCSEFAVPRSDDYAAASKVAAE